MISNKPMFDRFFRYISIDTQSSEEETQVQPSTQKQKDLAAILYAELQELGAEAFYDEENGYVYAQLPGEEPALGFVAHMDTSPAASGKDVKARIVEDYDGTPVILAEADAGSGCGTEL